MHAKLQVNKFFFYLFIKYIIALQIMTACLEAIELVEINIIYLKAPINSSKYFQGVTMATSGEADPDFFEKGIEYHNKGDFKSAVKMYTKSMKVHGVDKKTLVLLGNVYYMTKDFKESEKAYKKALSLDPNYSKAYFNLGVVYEKTKKSEKALKAYKKSIDLDSNFAEAYANLGDVYKEVRDIENAVLSYKKALEINSEIENAKEALKFIPSYMIEKATKRALINKSDELIRQGIELERSGDLPNATKKYEESLKLYPDSAAGFFLLKLSTAGSEPPVVAKDEIPFTGLNTALICDSISPEAREFLGEKLGGIKFEPKTLELFFDTFRKMVKKQKKEEVDLAQTSRSILFSVPGKALSKALDMELQDDIEGATAKYEEVLKRAPYLAYAYYLYGLLLEAQGLETEALSGYKKASRYRLEDLDEGTIADVVEMFSRREGYEYLREMNTFSILKEFQKATVEGESISLLRFIKYKLSLEAEAKITYGFEKEESGESNEAINAYEDAINIDPANPISHYVLGLAYESRGLKKEAMKEYEKTQGADFSGLDVSENIPGIIEEYLGKTTKDGHRVGKILSRYFEIIADDPEHMLELLGFIEDLKIESVSRIIKSYISTDMILGSEGKVVRDQLDFGDEEGASDEELGKGKGAEGTGALDKGDKKRSAAGDKRGGVSGGKIVPDRLDFGEDLDKEEEKIEKSRKMSKISFELIWKYKTQRSIRCEASTSDGKGILAGSENGIIYFIDQNANSPWRYDSGASVVDLDISPDGRYGVFCNSENVLELLDCTSEGTPLWKKNMSKLGINSVAIASEPVILAATDEFEIIFFDLESKKRGSIATEEIITMLDITDDGSTVLAASTESLFIITDRKSPVRLDAFKHHENIQSVSISKEGGLISVGTREGGIYLLDDKGKILYEYNIQNPVYGVSVSSNGDVVAGAMNGSIVLFSNEGEPLWKYQTGENIWAVGISKKGDMIISACGLVFGNIYLFTMK
jgi:tetratricopeptide (TPR) repeat protein